MNHVFAVARKELRAYFLSPIALIFLGTFLFVTLFTFFWVEEFFARNIADVRPLFSWLPVLLIFLCSALTMRLWTEEQRAGTLEVLLTLPVRTRDLVLGKFLASLALVGVALAMTFGVPITISMLGDLDWGPIFGGYLAAVLLAGAYLAIGLWVSAQTENQIVSLILSALICGVFYLIGADVLVDAVPTRQAEILSQIGTGSRFESIRRGVIDVRDLVYYASIIVVFLALNVLSLQAKGFSDGAKVADKRRNAVLVPVLLAANLVVFNVWTSGFGFLRADLTERGEYSISSVTKDMLRGLDEPLLIRGYFSAKTHPLLAPLVPRVRDIIEEYGEIGGGRVQTEYVDPREDEELEKEARQLYDIRSFPFQIENRLDVEVVNSYFSILVKYGDQFEVLSFQDLIDVSATGYDNVDVRLRNPEYDLTRAIKKVSTGFQTLDVVFASLEEPARLQAFITPETLPANFSDAPAVVKTVAEKLKEESGGKFDFSVVDPSQPGAAETAESLQQKYGFRPYSASLLGGETFYLHLLLNVGQRYERVTPSADGLSQADLEKALTESLERAAPGFLKTVGLVKPEIPPPNPQMPPQLQQQNQDRTRAIQQTLSENYTVEDVDISEGRVPSNVDVLVIVAPENFDTNQRFAVDQFLMRGGTVIVYDSPYRLNPSFNGSLGVKKVDSGLEDLYAAYGLVLKDELVMDPQNEGIQVPVERNLGGFTVREIKSVSYPFFSNIQASGMAPVPAIGGVPSVTVPFASPILVTQSKNEAGEDGPEIISLLESSPQSWTTTDTDVQPDFTQYPEDGFAVGNEKDAHTLAVISTGSLDSAFAGQDSPTGEPVIEASPESTRFALVASTAMVNDLTTQLSRQARSNLQLTQNLVDWGVQDTDLLQIRSRSAFARTLAPMDADERQTWELINYGIVIFLLALVIALTAGRRRSMQAMDLTKPSASSQNLAEAS
ncbi:MAG: Gldg family protein [Myxococcota bacterium]